jgi:hypothetical protein
MKVHHDTFLQCKGHFDRIARSWANRAKMAEKAGKNRQFYKMRLISQKLFDELFSNRTK